MASSREIVKAMIELAPDAKAADEIISQEFNFKSTQEKLACLMGMFDVEIIGRTDGEDADEQKRIETDYLVALSTVVGSKYRG